MMKIDKRYRYRVVNRSPDLYYSKGVCIAECQPWWCPKWWPVWWYVRATSSKDDAIKAANEHATERATHKDEVIYLGRLP